MPMNVRKLSDVVGAEVIGASIGPSLTDADFSTIEDTLHEHLVLVIRDQKVAPDDFVANTKVDYVGERPAQIHLRKCRLAVGAEPGGKGPGKGKGKGKGGGTPGVVKPTMADTIRANVYADNWFMMYINGKLAAVDSIDFIPHNVVSVDILPEYPMSIAVMAKDNADPKTGLEYGDRIGDGGFVLKFGDGTVSNAKWKAKAFFTGPRWP